MGAKNVGFKMTGYDKADIEKVLRIAAAAEVDNITFDGRNYTLVPFEGGSHFVQVKGDLNSNAGGDYIHLLYKAGKRDNN